MILSLQQAAFRKHYSRIGSVAFKTPNSSDRGAKGRKVHWCEEDAASPYLRAVKVCSRDLQASWESIMENASRSLHLWLLVFGWHVKVLTIVFFPCLILCWQQPPVQQSATIYGCQWDLHTYISALLNQGQWHWWYQCVRTW